MTGHRIRLSGQFAEAGAHLEASLTIPSTLRMPDVEATLRRDESLRGPDRWTRAGRDRPFHCLEGHLRLRSDAPSVEDRPASFGALRELGSAPPLGSTEWRVHGR